MSDTHKPIGVIGSLLGLAGSGYCWYKFHSNYSTLQRVLSAPILDVCLNKFQN